MTSRIKTATERVRTRVQSFLFYFTFSGLRDLYAETTTKLRPILGYTARIFLDRKYLAVVYFAVAVVSIQQGDAFATTDPSSNAQLEQLTSAIITGTLLLIYANALLYTEIRSYFLNKEILSLPAIHAIRHLPRLVAVFVIYLTIVFIASLTIVLLPLAIYWAIVYIYAQPITIVNNKSIYRSFKQSKQTVRGNTAFTYTILLLIGIPLSVVIGIDLFTRGPIATVALIGATTIIIPAIQIFITVSYLLDAGFLPGISPDTTEDENTKKKPESATHE